MTFLTITAICIGILALFLGAVWLGYRGTFRPPLETPPASWISKQIHR